MRLEPGVESGCRCRRSPRCRRLQAPLGFAVPTLAGLTAPLHSVALLLLPLAARDLHSALQVMAEGSQQRLFSWHRRGKRVALDIAKVCVPRLSISCQAVCTMPAAAAAGGNLCTSRTHVPAGALLVASADACHRMAAVCGAERACHCRHAHLLACRPSTSCTRIISCTWTVSGRP